VNIFKAITILCIMISMYALYTNGLLIRLFGEEGVIVIDKYANELYDKLPDDSKIIPLPQAPKTIKRKNSNTLAELEVRVIALESSSYTMMAIIQVIVPLIIPAIMYRFKSKKTLKKKLISLLEEKEE
jgi:hypothetical protein